MAEEIILRQCLEDDIESVLELWLVAGSIIAGFDGGRGNADIRSVVNWRHGGFETLAKRERAHRT